MARMDIVKQLKIDVEKTFGTLLFMGYVDEKMKEDSQGNQVPDTRYYDVYSSNQEEVLRIHVPYEVDKIDYPRKTPVKLVGDVELNYITKQARQLDDYLFIKVGNIVKVDEKEEKKVPPVGGAGIQK